MSAQEDIRRIVARCAQTIDDRDVEAYVSLFAPKGRLVTRSREFIGHGAIGECMANGWAIAAPGSKTKHLVGGSVIDISGERATALTDVVAFQCLEEGGWQILLTGRYHDEFMVHSGEWLFSARRITVDAFLRTTYGTSELV
jgi:hypothetical protein